LWKTPISLWKTYSRLWKTLKLPVFEFQGKQLIKRVTLIASAGQIVKVFYPVFPPDKNADEVIDWLQGTA
jgi:peroxiredoxin